MALSGMGGWEPLGADFVAAGRLLVTDWVVGLVAFVGEVRRGVVRMG